MGDNLLFGSKGLTSEEEALRAALIAWAQHRLDEGARPIPLYAALRIVSEMMRTCEGFERPKPKQGSEYDGWQGEVTETRARAALKQIIEISAGPIRRIAEGGLHKMGEQEMPGRIWISPTYSCKEPDDYYLLHPAIRNGRGTEYRRADLPPTPADAMRCPEVRALVEAMWDAVEEIDGHDGRNDNGRHSARARAAIAALEQGACRG